MDTSGPQCPNHAVPLEDCYRGVGICPISKCRFEYQAEEKDGEQTVAYDKFGNEVTSTNYKITPLDGDGG